MSLDVERLIVGDLQAARRGRARHFVPALVLTLLVIGGFLLLEGLRPDLWRQQPAQLIAQLAAWALCLVALPAVGLGLWFPARPVRALLIAGAVAAALVAGIGPGLWDLFSGTGAFGQAALEQGPRLDYCVTATFGSGLALLAIGALSGAFAQRRRPGSALWVSGGVALMALDAVAWHCPSDDVGHNLFSHLGAATLLLALAGVTGLIVHARQRRT